MFKSSSTTNALTVSSFLGRFSSCIGGSESDMIGEVAPSDTLVLSVTGTVVVTSVFCGLVVLFLWAILVVVFIRCEVITTFVGGIRIINGCHNLETRPTSVNFGGSFGHSINQCR